MRRRSLALSLVFFAVACGDAAPATDESSTGTESAGTETGTQTGDGDGDGNEDPPPEPDEAADELGPHPIGHTQLTLVDPERDDRSLLLDVWYPAGEFDPRMAEPAGYLLGGIITLPSEVAWEGVPVAAQDEPVFLVFSHGYRGIDTQSFQLCEALASHGFIVASPEHTGNSQADGSDDFDTAAANRVPDVSFVIDSFEAKSADPEDLFHERIEGARYGVVGHSFGGMTSIGAAAGWAGAVPDPRVEAVAPISAVIDGDLQSDERNSPNAGFTPDQLGNVSLPVMLIGGTEDVAVPVGNNALAFDWLTASSGVYRADIIGANHTHFSNVCAIGQLLIDNGIPQEMWAAIGAADLIEPYNATCGPDAFPIDEAIRLQNLYVVAFFRKYLFGEDDYDHYLSPQYAETESAIEYWEREE